MPGDDAADLNWAPAWAIRDAILRREVSPVDVVEHFLARIETLDPNLHAFSLVDRDGARAQARAAEAAVRAGETTGVLHGVPMVIKASAGVKGLPCPTDFSAAEIQVAQHDGIVVERLRAAGAVILGLGVTPGMGGRLIPGDQVPDLPDHPRNPWDLARVPGSSSAGVAAATAAGLVPAGIGGDDGGSTRLPAALSGLVGFHASRGRIPHVDYQRQGHNLTQSAGPLARDVRDAAQVMQVIAGPDARQFITRDEPAPDYVGELDRGVAGLRIAWTDDFGLGEAYPTPGADRIVQAVREAAHRFTALGAQMNVIDERWEDFWPANLVTGKAYGYSLSARGEAPPSPMALQAALEQRARTYATFAGVLRRHDLL